jgi:hypothetical protein
MPALIPFLLTIFNHSDIFYSIYTVRSEIRCALSLRYVDLVVSTEVAVEVCLMS